MKGENILNETVYNFKLIPQQERYYNEDSNWGVYTFTTRDDIPEFYDCCNNPFDDAPCKLKGGVLVGKMQRLTIGVEYKVSTKCEFNDKFRQHQYIPISIVSEKPKTIDQQVAYLKTQVTELQAKNILAVYPNIVSDVIEGKDIDYTIIKGIGKITWERIRNNIIENYVISDILVLLQPLGISYSIISKILAKENNPHLLKEKILENPYILTQVKGLGFQKVDNIAIKLNPQIKISIYRISAFIKYHLEKVGNEQGHSYITEQELDLAVKNNIGECYEVYLDFKEKQKQNGLFLHFMGGFVGLSFQYKLEQSVYQKLKQLNESKVCFNINIKNGIAEAEKEQSFKFTDEQINEIIKACSAPVVLITGGAGCGKTTILRALIKIYANYSIAACALSAKAAIRITEATNIPSSTIHRLLQYTQTGFGYNENNPLPQDVIILDEASMINSQMFYALISSIKKGSKIIIVGDDGQLPPIGCGNIFHDLINKNDFICCKLTTILRQAKKSGIISDSIKIRNGINPLVRPELKIVSGELQDMTYMFRENHEGMRDLAIKLFMRAAEKDGYNETIILTPCKQNRINSSFEINKILLDKIIPNGTADEIQYGNKLFRTGAKIIQRINDYEKNVFNGEIGYVKQIDIKCKCMIVDFGEKQVKFNQSELTSIDLAYCMTCHLTQGSGFKNVIIIIDNTHYKLLDRCMLYTAITRAKNKCALIAEPSAFHKCIITQASNRNSWTSILV